MNYLFLDTETTGFITPFYVPSLVSISWAIDDFPIETHIIKPDGWIVPLAATRIHKISHNQAMSEGKDLCVVLLMLREDMRKVKEIIIHNANFDLTVLEEVCCDLFDEKTIVCTMLSTIEFCAIPRNSRNGAYKFPKLIELYRKLFGKDFEGELHSSSEDVRCLRECWKEMGKHFDL